MPVHISENWPKHGVDLFAYADGPSYRIPFVVEAGRFVLDPNATIQVGEMLPVSLFIDYPMYEDLRRAMIGEAIANDDALKDTRNVRDRLLTLVENAFPKS